MRSRLGCTHCSVFTLLPLWACVTPAPSATSVTATAGAPADTNVGNGAAPYTPLPPAPPLRQSAVRASAAFARGQILQLWGHSQKVALTNPKIPEALQAMYGFDAVIAVPLAAHNSMCSAEGSGQQCNASDMLTRTEFDAGVSAFEAANVSLILYTSIMHAGHSPAWENGSLAAAHPEFSERDENGACPSLYGQCNLSPAGDGVGYALNYTLGLADANPSLAAVMIDNAFWQNNKDESPNAPDGGMLPSGFELAAITRFRSYVAKRFTSNTSLEFLGVVAEGVLPPNASVRAAVAGGTGSPTQVALVGVWKQWRSRAYAEATEAFREGLHPRNISVFANTVFWIDETPDFAALSTQWEYGASEELIHLDAVVSESHDSSASAMALKEEDGRVLTAGRPQLNYIAVFNQSCQSHYTGTKCPLRPQAVVEGMVIASFMSMARPWLVAWGLSPLIDAPSNSPDQTASVTSLSALMKFRAANFERLFDFGGIHGPMSRHARVGVLRALRHTCDHCAATHADHLLYAHGHDNANETGRAPESTGESVGTALRALGVGFRAETELTILRYNALEPVGPGAMVSSVDMLVCDRVQQLASAAVDAIVSWVRRGGTLIATQDCALYDEAGRPYGDSLLTAALGEGKHGNGSALFVNTTFITSSSEAVKMLEPMATVVSPRDPTTGKTTAWEATVWIALPPPSGRLYDVSPHRMVVHFSNMTAAGGLSTGNPRLTLSIKLPPVMSTANIAGAAFTPFASEPPVVAVTADPQGRPGFVQLEISDPPRYGIVELVATVDDTIL